VGSTSNSRERFAFDDFQADLQSRELFRQGARGFRGYDLLKLSEMRPTRAIHMPFALLTMY
jgi:hypothetical protein